MSDTAYLIALSEVLVPLGDSAFSQLSVEEQVFVLIWTLEADVNNGGFNQYFFNASSDHAGRVPHALRTVGANTTAQIVDRALARFPNGVPSSRTERQEALQSVDADGSVFYELDAEFYKYPDDLGASLARFVRAHKTAIRGA